MPKLSNFYNSISSSTSAIPLAHGQLPVFGTGQFKFFSSNGTFTVPLSISSIRVRVLGHGGYGGGSDYESTGGGGGEYAHGVFNVSSGTVFPVTVGTSVNFTTPNITSFGNLISAYGGYNGYYGATNPSNNGKPGSGGSGGDFRAIGGCGFLGGGGSGSPLGNGGNGAGYDSSYFTGGGGAGYSAISYDGASSFSSNGHNALGMLIPDSNNYLSFTFSNTPSYIIYTEKGIINTLKFVGSIPRWPGETITGGGGFGAALIDGGSGGSGGDGGGGGGGNNSYDTSGGSGGVFGGGGGANSSGTSYIGGNGGYGGGGGRGAGSGSGGSGGSGYVVVEW